MVPYIKECSCGWKPFPGCLIPIVGASSIHVCPKCGKAFPIERELTFTPVTISHADLKRYVAMLATATGHCDYRPSKAWASVGSVLGELRSRLAGYEELRSRLAGYEEE